MTAALTMPRQMWFDALSKFLADSELSPGTTNVLHIASALRDAEHAGNVTARDVDRTAEAASLGRVGVIGYLDALDQLGWLWKLGDETYELRIPTHMWHRLGEDDGAQRQAVAPSHAPSAPPPPPAPVAPRVVAREPRCALYRWYDKQHNLLYIGITYNPKTRAISHAAQSRWWPLVARQDVEWFTSRADAEPAERVAIRNERPLFNRAHNDTPGARERLIDYLTARKRTDLLFDRSAA